MGIETLKLKVANLYYENWPKHFRALSYAASYDIVGRVACTISHYVLHHTSYFT